MSETRFTFSVTLSPERYIVRMVNPPQLRPKEGYECMIGIATMSLRNAVVALAASGKLEAREKQREIETLLDILNEGAEVENRLHATAEFN
jgi:hypothetical protein